MESMGEGMPGIECLSTRAWQIDCKFAKVVVEYRLVLQALHVWGCTKYWFVGKTGAARYGCGMSVCDALSGSPLHCGSRWFAMLLTLVVNK